MANVFVHARHNAENTHIAVSRNGHAPFMLFRIDELGYEPHQSEPLSFLAVARWLKAKGMTAKPLDMERRHALEGRAFPYAVRVRCLPGLDAGA